MPVFEQLSFQRKILLPHLVPNPFSSLLMTRYHLGYQSAKYPIQYPTITRVLFSCYTGYTLWCQFEGLSRGCERTPANTGVLSITSSQADTLAQLPNAHLQSLLIKEAATFGSQPLPALPQSGEERLPGHAKQSPHLLTSEGLLPFSRFARM